MMKALIEKLTDRLLSMVGLGPDFSIDLRESFFEQITEDLYLGARPDRERVGELREAGITHVVSCLLENQRSKMEFLQGDFQHLFLGVHDGIHEDISVELTKFIDFAASAPAPNSKLFVHCEAGVSRSATLAIAWLMTIEAISFIVAYRRVREKRSRVLPNIGFASQLQRLEHQLQPQLATNKPSSLAQYLHRICNAPVEVEVLQSALERHGYDAPAALRMIFGPEIPRVVQGVRP